MSVPYLTEKTVTLIRDFLKAHLKDALSELRSDRMHFGDYLVIEAPPTESYFIYEPIKAYRKPAVIVICESFDMQRPSEKANMINAVARVLVSIIVEEKDQEKLTMKAWRYQSAIQRMLDLVSLTSDDSRVKLDMVVDRYSFSPMFTDDKNQGSSQAAFLKEVLVELTVHHYENFQ